MNKKQKASLAVDEQERTGNFPFDALFEIRLPLITEILSRRRALRQRVSDLENIVKVLQHQLDEIKQNNGLQ